MNIYLKFRMVECPYTKNDFLLRVSYNTLKMILLPIKSYIFIKFKVLFSLLKRFYGSLTLQLIGFNWVTLANERDKNVKMLRRKYVS